MKRPVLLYGTSLRYATCRKKTPGAIFLRKVMHKFNVTDILKSSKSLGNVLLEL